MRPAGCRCGARADRRLIVPEWGNLFVPEARKDRPWNAIPAKPESRTSKRAGA